MAVLVLGGVVVVIKGLNVWPTQYIKY